MEDRKKSNPKWKKFYWVMVLTIFIALIFLVRFVLNSSKIYVDSSTVINPYYIEWSLENDGSLRINDPYYLDSKAKFIVQDVDRIKMDTAIYSALIQNSPTGGTLADIKNPYLIWKHANSDTIHVLKNNLHLNFKLN